MLLHDLRIVAREEMRKVLLKVFRKLVSNVSDEEQTKVGEMAGELESYDENFEEL